MNELNEWMPIYISDSGKHSLHRCDVTAGFDSVVSVICGLHKSNVSLNIHMHFQHAVNIYKLENTSCFMFSASGSTSATGVM